MEGWTSRQNHDLLRRYNTNGSPSSDGSGTECPESHHVCCGYIRFFDRGPPAWRQRKRGNRRLLVLALTLPPHDQRITSQRRGTSEVFSDWPILPALKHQDATCRFLAIQESLQESRWAPRVAFAVKRRGTEWWPSTNLTAWHLQRPTFLGFDKHHTDRPRQQGVNVGSRQPRTRGTRSSPMPAQQDRIPVG